MCAYLCVSVCGDVEMWMCSLVIGEAIVSSSWKDRKN